MPFGDLLARPELRCIQRLDSIGRAGRARPFHLATYAAETRHAYVVTHQELLRAIERDKLRWFLVHEHVVVARQLLRPYRFDENGRPCESFAFKPTAILPDIRVIEMYEAAMRHDKPLAERTGNWVQSYFRHEDALQYVTTQFGNMDTIRQKLAERGPS